MSIFFPEDEGREVPEVDYQPILRTELVTGAAGPTGSQGPAGPVGPGVVTGGFTGQVLAKKTNNDYDTEWVTGGGGGGSAIWGGIAGTLSNQLDLQAVLDAKAPSSGISPSAISGTAVITTDPRLSDSRTPTGAASGDLGGTYPSPSVVKLQGFSVATAAPITGQSLGWTGSEWSAVTPLSVVSWGAITGTLSNQTDLQSALDAKALKITAITAGTGLTGGGDLSQSRTISMLADVPADSLNFNTAATETAAIGKMFWNSTEGSPQVGLAGGNVQLQMGSMVVAYVRNAEATTLNKGEVVYLFGASGNRAEVKRASNVGDPTSSKTMGIVAESIAANQVGFIVTQGVLDGLSLGSPYVSGDSIYLGTTPGTFTRVKPTQPDHIVFIGVVERANAGNGQMYIKPQNGFELEELHDVLVTSVQNNQAILWNSATTLWVNSTLTVGTISGLTVELANKANVIHTHPLSQLTQSGATIGQVPTWSGSDWVPTSPTFFQAYEHFITGAGIGLLGLTYAGLNGGNITQVTTNPAVFGAVRMATANNTTANTGARINGSGNINNFNPTGVGEFRFVSRIMRFSTDFFSPTIRGILRTGVADSINAGPSNGFFFSCQETNAVNFNTVAGGVTTSTPTGVSILQNQWNLFEFIISANGTSVTAKINGNTVATHTTNIPNAYMFPITNILKYQADPGLVQLDVDYIYISLIQ